MVFGLKILDNFSSKSTIIGHEVLEKILSYYFFKSHVLCERPLFNIRNIWEEMQKE